MPSSAMWDFLGDWNLQCFTTNHIFIFLMHSTIISGFECPPPLFFFTLSVSVLCVCLLLLHSFSSPHSLPFLSLWLWNFPNLYSVVDCHFIQHVCTFLFPTSFPIAFSPFFSSLAQFSCRIIFFQLALFHLGEVALGTEHSRKRSSLSFYCSYFQKEWIWEGKISSLLLLLLLAAFYNMQAIHG